MPAIPADVLELAAAYADESRLSIHVCAAFVAADMEPPHRDRVDHAGYSAPERVLIDAFFEKYDPNHSKLDGTAGN